MSENHGTIHLNKVEAARRQLRTAIVMLFNNNDPVAVHTLVGAASVIITDLVEHHAPDKSWDKLAQEANHLTPKEYFGIMRKPQNFLKHARDDPSATFDFNPDETESVAFWATMNLSVLGTLETTESVFQAWYLACRAPTLEKDIEPYIRIREIFGDLRESSRAERIAVGKRILEQQLAE